MAFILMIGTVFALAVPTDIDAATIAVPDDYPTIQQAVNAAFPGDTVYVPSGTYHEHVTIGKALILQGEDRNTTVVDGGGTGDVIYLNNVNNVHISEFTIQNGQRGVYLRSSSNNTIESCNMTLNSEFGMLTYMSSTYNTIVDCDFWSNLFGIHFDDTGNHHNSMINCNV